MGRRILQALDGNKDGKLQANESHWGAANARLHIRGNGAMVGALLGVVDEDADGLVTGIEFQTLLERLQEIGDLAESYLAVWFDVLDVDDDGAITVVESQMMADAFVMRSRVEIQPISALGPAPPAPPLLPLVWQKIARLDRNRDGRISQREVRQDDQLRGAFGLIDQDGDGFLNAGELFEYLQSKNRTAPDAGLRIRFRVKTRG